MLEIICSFIIGVIFGMILTAKLIANYVRSELKIK
jgi:uncharacterized protein YneF (UPF0154 family)